VCRVQAIPLYFPLLLKAQGFPKYRREYITGLFPTLHTLHSSADFNFAYAAIEVPSILCLINLKPRGPRSFIGSYVIQSSNPLFAPQIRFNCLNKPVSAHPSLYGTQVRPYLLTCLSEGLRPPSVLPMRSRDASLALRCFRASA